MDNDTLTAAKTMRDFIDRQHEKIEDVRGENWRNGYKAALDNMATVLDAIPVRAATMPAEELRKAVSHFIRMADLYEKGHSELDHSAPLFTTYGSCLRLRQAWEKQCSSPVSDAWQPIETAPKDGRHVILGCNTYVDSGYWDADGWTLYPDDTRPEESYCVRFHPEPTHWMPMPEPPLPTIPSQTSG